MTRYYRGHKEMKVFKSHLLQCTTSNISPKFSCPDIHTFFTERLYDPEDGLRIIRNAIPDKVARIEKEINLELTAESMHDFYFKMDEVIVAKYGATDEADLELY